MAALRIRGLLFAVQNKAPDFWKLPDVDTDIDADMDIDTKNYVDADLDMIVFWRLMGARIYL